MRFRFPPRRSGDRELHSPQFITMQALLDEPEETQPWLVDRIVAAGGLVLVVASPKVGKSTLMRTLTLAVARGMTWLGRETAQGAVLYWCLEDLRSEVRRHYVAMGACASDPVHLIFDRAPPGNAIAVLRRYVESVAPRLVVVDPLFRLLRVHDASDYARVTRAFDPLIELARTSGGALAFTHHERKSGGTDGAETLGSQAIFGSVDNAVFLSRSGDTRTIRTQVRVGEDMAPTRIWLRQDGWFRVGGRERDRHTRTTEKEIVACLAEALEPLTMGTIRSRVARRAEAMDQALKRLADTGGVRRAGRGCKADPYRFQLPATRQSLPIDNEA